MRNVDYCDFYLNTAGNVRITNCLEELSTDLRCLIILQKYSLHIEYSVKVHLKFLLLMHVFKFISYVMLLCSLYVFFLL